MNNSSMKINIRDLNSHLTCVLCGGYYIDATTIIECLHSFCKSCIVRYLETTKYCPICDVLVHKTRPLLNIRPDQTLQDLVYKLVPGLFTKEMKHRRLFYTQNPVSDDASPLDDPSKDPAVLETSSSLYTEEDSISLAMIFSPNGQPVYESKRKRKDRRGTPQTIYLLCPAPVKLGLLKKFLRLKFDLDPKYHIDIFHIDEPLSDHYTLMDIAYIYTWRRVGPFRLFYSIYEVQQPVKRRRSTYAQNGLVEVKTEMPEPIDNCPHHWSSCKANHRTYPAPVQTIPNGEIKVEKNCDDYYHAARFTSPPCPKPAVVHSLPVSIPISCALFDYNKTASKPKALNHTCDKQNLHVQSPLFAARGRNDNSSEGQKLTSQSGSKVTSGPGQGSCQHKTDLLQGSCQNSTGVHQGALQYSRDSHQVSTQHATESNQRSYQNSTDSRSSQHGTNSCQDVCPHRTNANNKQISPIARVHSETLYSRTITPDTSHVTQSVTDTSSYKAQESPLDLHKPKVPNGVEDSKKS